MAFSNGEIHFYEVETKEAKDAGVLDGNILAAKWSPNEERYAVASSNGVIYMFSPEFDMICQAEIDDQDLTFASGTPSKESDSEISEAFISWRGDSSIL